MSFTLRMLVCLLTLAFTISCTHTPLRLPSSARSNFNPRRVQLLRLAAQHGILFQFSDTVLRDLPVKVAGDTCRKSEEGPWIENLFMVLEDLQQNPSLLEKIHIIQFTKGDRASAEVSKDLDGAATLKIYFVKLETREKIHLITEIPCAGDMGLVGKEMSVTRFEWPTKSMINTALAAQPDRAIVERMTFDHRFPMWLADHMTIFRLTEEVAFEKTSVGQNLLPVAMARLAEDLSRPGEQDQIEYWLNEISARSRLASSVQFFALKKDSQAARGIQVDSSGKFARKMNGFSDPTYMYLSYRVENMNFAMTGLADLNRCLVDLSNIYRSPMSLMSSFESDAESFLYPGFHCQGASPAPDLK